MKTKQKTNENKHA